MDIMIYIYYKYIYIYTYTYIYRERDKSQPQKLCISVAFTQVSNLGLHPEMLPNLAHSNYSKLQ